VTLSNHDYAQIVAIADRVGTRLGVRSWDLRRDAVGTLALTHTTPTRVARLRSPAYVYVCLRHLLLRIRQSQQLRAPSAPARGRKRGAA
jgi:hypothetical protein